MQKAFQEEHGKSSLTPGADQVNIPELVVYLGDGVDMGEADRDHFLTGQERPLWHSIVAYSREHEKRLSPEEVFGLSLELNEGNLYNALLTAHNCVLNLARIKESTRSFIATYLNDDLTGQNTLDTGKTIVDDVGGNWYYFFGLATLSLVSNHRAHHTPIGVNCWKDVRDVIAPVARHAGFGVLSFSIQLAADLFASLVPYDGIVAYATKKTAAQWVGELLRLDTANIPSPAPGNLLPWIAATYEQVRFKVGEPSRQGMPLWQKDRYSVSMAAIAVGEDLANPV